MIEFLHECAQSAHVPIKRHEQWSLFVIAENVNGQGNFLHGQGIISNVITNEVNFIDFVDLRWEQGQLSNVETNHKDETV